MRGRPRGTRFVGGVWLNEDGTPHYNKDGSIPKPPRGERGPAAAAAPEAIPAPAPPGSPGGASPPQAAAGVGAASPGGDPDLSPGMKKKEPTFSRLGEDEGDPGQGDEWPPPGPTSQRKLVSQGKPGIWTSKDRQVQADMLHALQMCEGELHKIGRLLERLPLRPAPQSGGIVTP